MNIWLITLTINLSIIGTYLIKVQNPVAMDSLNDAYKHAGNDSLRFWVLKQLFDETLYQDYEASYSYAKEALGLAITNQDTSQLALANYQLGVVYNNVSQADSAYYHYNNARELYRQLQDSAKIENTNYAIAILWYGQGKFDKAIEQTNQLIELYTYPEIEKDSVQLGKYKIF